MTLEAHEIAERFPLLEGAAYEQFREDIKLRGLMEPIWLYQGKILDGRNRYRACTELGIEVRTREYMGESPVGFSWSMNGARRDLTHAQRVVIALEMLPEMEVEANARNRERLRTAPRNEKGFFVKTDAAKLPTAAEAAGKKVGVGPTSVYQAKRIRDQAPDLFEKVKAGELSVATAFRQAEQRDDLTRMSTRQDRATQIRILAEQGYRSEQIAKELKLGHLYVREVANEYNISLAGSKTPHIHVERVVEETVSAVEGIALGLQTVEGKLHELPPQQAAEWADALGGPVKALVALRKKLLEVAVQVVPNG